MSTGDDRTKAWTAYFLGEASAEERERIEAELRASPEEAAELQRFVESVRRWAKEPTPYTPLDMEHLRGEVAGLTVSESPTATRRRLRFLSSPLAWSFRWVAVAICLLALTQVHFSVTAGDKTFTWGHPGPQAQMQQVNDEIQLLAEQLRAVQQAAAKNSAEVQAVTLKNLLLDSEFRQATAQLARNQRIEAETRYHDTQNLLRLTGFEQPAGPRW